MHMVTYSPPSKGGTYILGTLTFYPGKAQSVTDEIVAQLKGENHFLIDGVRTESIADYAQAQNGGSVRPEDASRPLLPANGFQTKQECIDYAAKYLPGLELDAAKAIPTLTRKIMAAYEEKYGEAAMLNAAMDKAAAGDIIDTGKGVSV